MTHKTCTEEEYRALLMGLLDGELTPEESVKINAAMSRSSRLREEYEALRQAGDTLRGISFIEPDEALARKFWRNPYSGFGRAASLVLIVGGYAGLIGYGVFEALRTGTEELPAKLMIGAIAIGFAMLLLQTIVQRLLTWKNDPYKEIER